MARALALAIARSLAGDACPINNTTSLLFLITSPVCRDHLGNDHGGRRRLSDGWHSADAIALDQRVTDLDKVSTSGVSGLRPRERPRP
jgi:hypothetical protein